MKEKDNNIKPKEETQPEQNEDTLSDIVKIDEQAEEEPIPAPKTEEHPEGTTSKVYPDITNEFDSNEIKKIIAKRNEPDAGSIMNYNSPLYKDARSCAVKIICRFERSDSYIDKLLDVEFRTNHFLNDFDKSLLNELTHGVVRWMRRLDWFLNGFYRGNYEKCSPEVKNAMRVALYQILFLNKIPYSAAVNEAVEFVKRIHNDKHAGVVNGLLRTIIRTLDSLVWPTRDVDEVNYLGIVQSHPNWLVRRWIDRFGFDNAQKLCEANNKRPSISMRMNTLKTNETEFSEYLNSKEIIYSRTNYLKEFFNVKVFPKIYEDEFFKAGKFSIQDESAGLVSHLVDPKDREIILDCCAAPGGKSAHMAELSGGKAKIVAVEKYFSRAENMKKNFDRMDYKNITALYDDISEPKTELLKNKLIGKADKVLVDAPCTGFGVISKKPDIKWKREFSDIEELQKIQSEILENVVKYLKPNGVLVYSTCTTAPEENSEVIKLFLEKHNEFEVDSADKYVDSRVVNSEGYIETLPHVHEIDGSFAARLIKKY
jgi:16S rRNA (cytosine967-C5)-methyltransferase